MVLADEDTERHVRLTGWLTEQGLVGAVQEELLAGYCTQLVEVGLPLVRVHATHRAFHPEYGGIGFSWHRNVGVEQELYGHTRNAPDRWLESPFYAMLGSVEKELRVDMRPDGYRSEFPVLNELRDAGVTDYFATGLLFEKGDFGLPVNPELVPEGMLISWCSDSPGGFGTRDISLLRSTLPALGLALKSAANRQMGHDLLQVYLGRDPGKRVMSGEIRRGSLQEIDAVIAYFDLTGFTSLTEKTPGPALIEMLNDYFGVVVSSVHAHGGNILKFMGDGILLMFDLDDRRTSALAALDAVSDLKILVNRLNTDRASAGLPVTGYTLAIHAGDILYGNIGAESRLDFTVIGPAVNLTARLSGMHGALGRSVVISQTVQEAAQPCDHDLVSMGRYMLRGVSRPLELYTIHEPEAG